MNRMQASLREAPVSRSGAGSRIRPRKYLEYPSRVPRNEEMGERPFHAFALYAWRQTSFGA